MGAAPITPMLSDAEIIRKCRGLPWSELLKRSKKKLGFNAARSIQLTGEQPSVRGLKLTLLKWPDDTSCIVATPKLLSAFPEDILLSAYRHGRQHPGGLIFFPLGNQERCE